MSGVLDRGQQPFFCHNGINELKKVGTVNNLLLLFRDLGLALSIPFLSSFLGFRIRLIPSRLRMIVPLPDHVLIGRIVSPSFG